MRFTALSALLGLLAVQQAAAVSVLLPPSFFLRLRRATSNSAADRERLARIGNVLRVSLFVQNLPTSVATRRRVVSVAPKSPSQHRALVPAFREWVSKMEITAR